MSTINFGLSFHPVWSLFRTVLQLILLIQTSLFFLEIGVLLILECFDRKQLKFSKNNTVLSQPNHFLAHKEWFYPTFCQVGTYIPVGSYIKFQDLSGRYLNSSRFFNSGLRSRSKESQFISSRLKHIHTIYKLIKSWQSTLWSSLGKLGSEAFLLSELRSWLGLSCTTPQAPLHWATEVAWGQ